MSSENVPQPIAPATAIDDAVKQCVRALGGVLNARIAPDAPLANSVATLFRGLGKAPAAALASPALAKIGPQLEQLGVYSRFSAEILTVLPRAGADLGGRRDFARHMVNGAFELLRFPSANAKDWADDVFRLFVIPMFEAAIAAGIYEEALMVEHWLYGAYVKPRENADHFRAVYAQIAPMFSAAGRAFGKPLPPLRPLQRRERYRVAFFALNLGYLAHVATAIDVIECIHNLPGNRINCALIGLVAPDPQTIARCAKLGIKTHTLIDSMEFNGSMSALYASLRAYFTANDFDAVVWLSAAPSCAFAMAMRLAPVQIFFAMKYHSLRVAEIDAYLSGGPAGQRFDTIEGQTFRIGQTKYADLFLPSLTAPAAEVRNKVGQEWILLGCLGREDKINSVPFLDAVCALLKRHPNAAFLWTGKQKLAAIQEHFERAGVANRCVFIGWVNTRLYAQVLDIFLDSFPFPCGVTALQTMAAGKPVLFFDSPEARETGVPLFVRPVLEEKVGDEAHRARYRELLQPDAAMPLFPFARDPHHYGQLADALVADPAYRARVGQALKSFVDEFLTDSMACGRTYEAHIFEAIDAVAAAGPRPSAA